MAAPYILEARLTRINADNVSPLLQQMDWIRQLIAKHTIVHKPVNTH